MSELFWLGTIVLWFYSNPLITLMFQPICICQSKVGSPVHKWNVCHKLITLHCFGYYFKDEYFICVDCWDCQPKLQSSLFNQFVSFPTFPLSPPLSKPTRNACGSTRMRRSGLPSSGSCVRLIRAWKTCSTMGSSSQLATGGTASSWMKSASFESTPSQSARVSRVWR